MDLLKKRGASVRLGWTIFLLLAGCGLSMAGETGNEYEVKAAFLFKFVSFVEWPKDVPAIPVGICVLGQDPFGQELERVVKGKSINGRDFLIRRVKTADAAGDCHILFIGASESNRLPQILIRLRGVPVLTVGDLAGFCESGGTINLVVSDNRVQLEINPAAAERARLLVSSRLLSLARIVREEPKGSR
jgi:YfiR/HmsC-like